MNFDYSMSRPCAGCPFGRHKNAVRHLGAARIRDIVEATGFTCHQTTRETGDGSERECAGFMAYQLANGTPTQIMRIAERLGGAGGFDVDGLQRSLDEGLVITDLLELIEAHDTGRRQ